MATFYLDYEGGSDAADGTSFANRWKTITSGATAARIAPGDTIRIMGSPLPTSLGMTAGWTDRDTSSAKATTVAITSSTNASPIVVTRASHGLSNGDTVVITGHATNTNANGTWEIANVTTNTFELVGSTGNGVGGATGTYQWRNNCVVRLNSAVTAEIASHKNAGEGRVAWTASANVTATLSSSYKCGSASDSIAIAAGFTTGLAAYFPTGTLNLSGYQQVSFFIAQTAGTLGASSACSLTLCSDTAGATPVNTINIPTTAILGAWMAVTVNLATNLGSSIQSIGFVVNTDNGAQTFLISNVIAVKAASSADSLSLTSLIGKNTTGETWWAVQSIVGTRVMLDGYPNHSPATTEVKGYSGTTETVTTYKRETIKYPPVGVFSTGLITVNDSGTLGASGPLITYEGGWNRTDMSTQDSETWWDAQNGNGYFINVGTRHKMRFNKISLIKAYYGLMFGTAGLENEVDNGHFNNHAHSGLLVGERASSTVIGTIWGCANRQAGAYLGSMSGGTRVTSITALSNSLNNGVIIDSWGAVVDSIIANNNGSSATGCGLGFIGAANRCLVKSLVANKNWGAAIAHTAGGTNSVIAGSCSGNQQGVAFLLQSGACHVKNFAVSEATVASYYGTIHGGGGRLQLENFNNTPGDHRIYKDFGLIRNNTSIRHTASGYSWSLAPTPNNNQITPVYPLDLPLAFIPVAANIQVTVKVWMRRSNTGLTMKLMCRGGQVAGVASDVSSSMTVAADTWEELSISFTPTEAGAVEIHANAYGGSTYTGYVDDLSVTPLLPSASFPGLDFVYQAQPLVAAASPGGHVIGG